MDTQATNLELAHNFDYLQLPIGVYFVAPDGRFLTCNRRVRQMLGLPLEGAVNASLADFYADPQQRPELLQKTIQADERGEHLEKEIIRLRVNGREMYVEDYCKPLRNPASGEIVGYVGCLVNVTKEHEIEKKEEALQSKVEELTYDIGRVLHANTSTLLMAQQTLDGVAEALGQRKLRDLIALHEDELDEQLVEQAAQLASVIEKFIQGSDPARRGQALPEYKWEDLSAKIEPLRQARENIPVELRAAALRSAAHQVTLIAQEIAPGVLPRERARDLLHAAAQLERSGCLIDVLTTRAAVIQMDASLRSLRDFITSDVREHELPASLALKHLAEHAIAHVAEFAHSAKVEIVWRERDTDAQIAGNERDLTRAFSNLLHNAIKYSWRRDRARAPWVTVRTYTRDQWVCIEFENWGVPIAREEIEQGLIFQLGYRGKWSKDRGRLGTGIGLTDAKRVAEAHGGTLAVESRPATPGGHRPDSEKYYQQPFLTTVRMCLPRTSPAG
ncbi:MAG: PAS domain-containing sensor histidine kinase [Chloroflexi bacterium]|nr:PAS domain-containing sensor histidine kinase [Chloroflexota bacterium]